eukprot:scaffold451800_cov24-Prasinocladus_malaysianus.AAC.2
MNNGCYYFSTRTCTQVVTSHSYVAVRVRVASRTGTYRTGVPQGARVATRHVYPYRVLRYDMYMITYVDGWPWASTFGLETSS